VAFQAIGAKNRLRYTRHILLRLIGQLLGCFHFTLPFNDHALIQLLKKKKKIIDDDEAVRDAL